MTTEIGREVRPGLPRGSSAIRLSPKRKYVDESPEWLPLADEYRLHLLTSGHSKETTRTYCYHASRFARFCASRDRSFVTAPRELVAAWVGQAYETMSCSAGANRLLGLRAFYRYAQTRGWREDDPTSGMKVRRKRLLPRPPFTPQEISALLGAASSLYEKSLIMTFVVTGARRAEVAGIDIEDVDFQRGLILLRQAKGGKERWAAPGDTTMQAIAGYLAESGRTAGPLWLGSDGQRLRGDRVLRIAYRLGRAAGVRAVHPHRFRVTFANAWLAAGGDLLALQRRMGHSKIEMTAHYAGYEADQRGLEMQRKLGDLLEGNP